MNRWQNLWAHLTSAVFHPMLMPSFAVIILFSIPSYILFSFTPEARRIITLIVFVNTCIAPLLLIILFKKTGLIQSIRLTERKDRILPTLASVALYLFTYYIFRQANVPSLLSFFILGGALLVLTGFMITFYWKISLHMMSIGGFTGFLIITSLVLRYEMPLLIVGSIIISGLLGSARIRLNAHTPAQVYTGFITGISLMMFLFLYLTP